MAELTEQDSPEAHDGRSQDVVHDPARIGDRVSAILQSAEAAAEQIRAEAASAAAEIRTRAEVEGAARRSQLTHAAERQHAEADAYSKDTRQAAEAYATQHRRQAEEEVARLLAEAQEQARATKQAAEEMAKQLETAAVERRDALRAGMRTVEARLQRTLEGLLDLTSQLQALVGQPSEEASESLDDAVKVGHTGRFHRLSSRGPVGGDD